jgi:para-aminobenzoate synthetase/4-amino-4-deoxychorismate lyase
VNEALIRDPSRGQWLYFSHPLELVATHRSSEVPSCLRYLEQQVETQRLYAVGFLSYEASLAFDPAYRTRDSIDFPRLWFGLYRKPEPFVLPIDSTRLAVGSVTWRATISPARYRQAIGQIRRHIRAGDTYQVNYTLRQCASFDLSAWRLFLATALTAPYAAYLDTDRYTICSASPELFFRSSDGVLTSRPMKGTAARGRTNREDQAIAAKLRRCEKERAENVMIVDMVRNDIGRIAQTGSVRVSQLFELERYPTVWQMTSTITAKTNAGISDALHALFPCASVTGAPKINTMKLIAELEDSPRKIYTGCIGFLAPRRTAQFNVAIRTILVDKQRKVAEYGVGSGVVWDSRADKEYEECVTKTHILNDERVTQAFELVETMLWEPAEGYLLLKEHLWRLHDSARYFDYVCDIGKVREKLSALERRLPRRRLKVRLLLANDGSLSCEHEQLASGHAPLTRVAIAPNHVDRSDPFLFHKTTNRTPYERASREATRLNCEDALLWNEEGQVTETCVANIVIREREELITPPVECGLLNGTFRSSLVAKGWVKEKNISLQDVSTTTELYLINSVRGWRRARIEGTHAVPRNSNRFSPNSSRGGARQHR